MYLFVSCLVCTSCHSCPYYIIYVVPIPEVRHLELTLQCCPETSVSHPKTFLTSGKLLEHYSHQPSEWLIGMDCHLYLRMGCTDRHVEAEIREEEKPAMGTGVPAGSMVKGLIFSASVTNISA
jgi:hypothetical protein